MLRAVVLGSVVVGCAACKPAAPTDIGHVGSRSVAPSEARPTRRDGSPSAVLTARVHAKVTIETTLPVPGGHAYVYTHGRLESLAGERAAAGHDVAAELVAEQRHCEDERAALDPAEREELDADDRSCEALAGAALFADAQLTPTCRDAGVAFFDDGGQLRGDVAIGGACLRRIVSLEAYDLTPEPSDELLLMATFASHGEQGDGDWGVTEEATRLLVLGLVPDEENRLAQQLDLELDVTREGGPCSRGIHRSLRVAGPGRLEVFSQEWSDCDREHCVDPAEAAGMLEDEDADAIPVCPSMPVAAAVTTWSPEGKAWSVLDPLPYEGTVLPDGIRR